MGRATPAAIFLAALGSILLQSIVPFRGRDLFWGLHHLAFFPGPIRLAAGGIAIAALVFLYRRSATLSLPCFRPSRSIVAIGILSSSLVLFYLLRIRHQLLGDAYTIVERGPHPPAFLLGDQNNTHVLGMIHRSLAALFPDIDWITTLTLTSCAAGGFYLFCSLWLADYLGKTRIDRLLAFVAMTTTGGMQLFFGYVEEYVLMTACLGGVILCLVRWEGRELRWLIGAFLCSGTAFFLHPIALFSGLPVLWAALLQLWTWSRRKDRRYLLLVAALAGTAVTLFVLEAAGHLEGFISPSAAKTPYHLLSLPHLRDALNQYLLLVPMHGALCALLLWRVKCVWRDPVLICLLLGTGAAWTTTFLIDPQLGSLDWDLLSLYAVPCAGLTAYLVARYLTAGEARRILPCFAIGALFHLIPWLLVNTSPEQSAAMVESMVRHDLHYCGRRNALLGAKLQNAGALDAAIRQYEKALECDPEEPLALYNLGLATYGERSVAQGLELLARFLEVAPPQVDRRLVESILAFHQGRTLDAALHCALFILDNPTRPQALELGRLLQARVPHDPERGLIDCALLTAAGDPVEAIRRCAALAGTWTDERPVAEFARILHDRVRQSLPSTVRP